MKMTSSEDRSTTIPFGKHEGKDISAVDDGYLLWLVSKVESGNPFRAAVDAEYKRRKIGPSNTEITFGKHAGTLISDLDTCYLVWCVNNWDESPFLGLIGEELELRDVDPYDYDPDERR